MTTVTIVGGGSSAHVLISLLSKSNLKVQLLTSKPGLWAKEIALDFKNPDGYTTQCVKGVIEKSSSSYSELIPTSDIVVLCMPVHQYNNALKKIAPHVAQDRVVYIGAIYGQGGFNWMVDYAFAGTDRSRVISFAVGLLPWICRVSEYGRVGINYGGKEKNLVALSDKSKFNYLKEIFLNPISSVWKCTGEFYLVENFISLTLSVDNQIIHPSRCYGLYEKSKGRWANRESIPLFYKDFDEFSADILKKIDSEYTMIRESIKEKFKTANFEYMLDYLALERFSYSSSVTDIQQSFTESRVLSAIKPPVISVEGGYAIDTEHRFFLDDIDYGLCIAKWFASKLLISTPAIDNIIKWAREATGNKDPIESGTPDAYGICTLTDAVDV